MPSSALRHRRPAPVHLARELIWKFLADDPPVDVAGDVHGQKPCRVLRCSLLTGGGLRRLVVVEAVHEPVELEQVDAIFLIADHVRDAQHLVVGFRLEPCDYYITVVNI